jgi:hypothetical protein
MMVKRQTLMTCAALLVAVWFSEPLCASTFGLLNVDFLGRGGGPQGMLARTGDIDNVVWNPSGLGFPAPSGFFASFMDYLVELEGGTVGFSWVRGNTGYGGYVSYLTSGVLARTGWDDQVGSLGQTFSHQEWVAGAAAGTRVLPWLALGLGLKVARQELDDVNSMCSIVDVGSTVQIYPLRSGAHRGLSVRAAFVSRNLVLTRWEDSGGEIPRNSELGVAVESPRSHISGGLSLYFGADGRREVRLGMTAVPSSEFEVRAGYRRRTGRMSDSAYDLPWERGLMAGFGVGFGMLWVDYTYENASPLDGIHRLGLRVVMAQPR